MKTYLVTGCGRGLGFALTQSLLERGDRVLGSTRDGRVALTHPAFRALAFDVRDDDAVRKSSESTPERIDVVINNAGIVGLREPSALAVDYQNFADVLNVNVFGTHRVIRAFLPQLRQGSAPKILTVSSQVGGTMFSGTDRPAYRSSKAALNKLMQCIGEELAAEGIAVVTAHPGWVKTDMGGDQAEVSPRTSAAGLLQLLDELTLANTGRFMNWDGSERAW